MINIDDLVLMNDTKIIYLEKLGVSSDRNKVIQKLLKDDTCFFKMKENDAFTILKEIGISEDKILSAYLSLTSEEKFNKLLELGKIKKEERKNI